MQLNVVQYFAYVYGHNSVTSTFLKYRITQSNASQRTKSPFRMVNILSLQQYFNSTDRTQVLVSSLYFYRLSAQQCGRSVAEINGPNLAGSFQNFNLRRTTDELSDNAVTCLGQVQCSTITILLSTRCRVSPLRPLVTLLFNIWFMVSMSSVLHRNGCHAVDGSASVCHAKPWRQKYSTLLR